MSCMLVGVLVVHSVAWVRADLGRRRMVEIFGLGSPVFPKLGMGAVARQKAGVGRLFCLSTSQHAPPVLRSASSQAEERSATAA